jgi:hypothetical protein
MTRFLRGHITWVLVLIAIAVNVWQALLIPFMPYGAISFHSAYAQTRLGMSWQEWQELGQQAHVRAACDGTDCYVNDLLWTYNVSFGKKDGELRRIYSKRTYLHFPGRSF